MCEFFARMNANFEVNYKVSNDSNFAFFMRKITNGMNANQGKRTL